MASVQKYKNRVSYWIKQRHYKLYEVAEAVNIPLRTLNDYCQGRTQIPRDRLEALSTFLECPISWLQGEAESQFESGKQTSSISPALFSLLPPLSNSQPPQPSHLPQSDGIFKHDGEVSIPERMQHVAQTTLDWFQDSLSDSWELYYTGTSSDLENGVDRKIRYLQHFIDATENREDQPLLYLKCRFHLLSARIAADQMDYQKAFAQLKQARELAAQLKSQSLLAAALFWRGRIYLERGDQERGDFPAAVTALDKALTYVPDDHPQLKGAILLEGGLAHAYTASTPEEKEHALALFAQALEFAKLEALESDGSFVKLTIGRYYHFKAEAYIAMGMPEEALETLDLAEEKTGPELTRRRVYINILRSQASLDMGDYPFAAHAALDAFNMCKAIGSEVNLAFIRELSSRLNKSPYANSEAATQLRVALRTL